MIKDEIKNDLQSLFKRKPIVYKYISFEKGKELLNSKKILFKCPTIFNDPYDCYNELVKFENIPAPFRTNIYDKFHGFINEKERISFDINSQNISDFELKEFISNKALPLVLSQYGITCFSKNYNNLLMWSHYAESHKGMCIGFDLEKLYFGLRDLVTESTILCVKYSRKFEPVNYFEEKYSVLNCMRVKSHHWKYEKEIRITISPINFSKSNSILLPIEAGSINRIYFGSKMSTKNEDTLIEICKKKFANSRLLKMELNKYSFNLKTKKVNNLSR